MRVRLEPGGYQQGGRVPSSDPRLKTPARKRLRAAVAALGLPCNKCGQPIDYTGAWDLDELTPRIHGGNPLDPGNVAPAHTHCNRAAGAAITNTRHTTTPRTSGVWG